MDQLDEYWRDAEAMTPQLNKIGTNTSRLNETADCHGVNPLLIEQCPSRLPGKPPTAYTKLKRKAPETARDREKKRETDKAYRRRCKDKKLKTEQTLSVLTEENKKLERENEAIKREEVKRQQIVQSQKDAMTLQQNEFSQLNAQLQRQTVVVDVLSKQLARSENNMNPPCENNRLKLERDLLIKKIKNNDYLNLIQLQEKIVKLVQEKKNLQVIIDALCSMINKDNDLEPKQAF